MVGGEAGGEDGVIWNEIQQFETLFVEHGPPPSEEPICFAKLSEPVLRAYLVERDGTHEYRQAAVGEDRPSVG